MTLKKYNLVKLFKLASEFSPRIDFWRQDFAWRDIALGEMGSVCLKDSDYFSI